MSVVTSALGFGGFLGQFGWPGLSDKFGRQPLALLGFIGATLALWWFANTGPAVLPLFAALFVCSFFCLGNVALITGPIATESAPRGLVSSAIGLVVGVGEIFGGGVAPIIAGSVADRFGLPSVFYVALSGRRARYRRVLLRAGDRARQDQAFAGCALARRRSASARRYGATTGFVSGLTPS